MKANALSANTFARRSAGLLLAAAACAFASGSARAGDVYWSIGINTPQVGTVVSNLPPAPPVIYAPARVYVPAPVYYRAAPIVYAPTPVYVAPRGHGHWKHAHRHRGHDGQRWHEGHRHGHRH